jgi:hypothetical protein
MRTFLLFLLLSALPAIDSQAAAVDVYTGVAAVAGKDVKERNQALPQALRNVLQKISGLRSFEDYPQVEPALGQASSILLSFYYQNREAATADVGEQDELQLVAKFSPPAVDDLVRTLGLPLWPANRNPVDLWVVVDDGLDRRVMPVEFSYAWKSMAEVADQRGLPVHWPEPDSEGLYTVDAQLLWGGYTEDLGLPPEQGAMILAARREGVEWGVRSNMTYEGQSWTWRVLDIDLQVALTESLEQAVDRIAAAHTIAATDLGAWTHRLTVTGIRSAADYRRCLSYLQGIGIVTDVSVIAARSGEADFSLDLSATPRYLEEALAGGRVLEWDEKKQRYLLQP